MALDARKRQKKAERRKAREIAKRRAGKLKAREDARRTTLELGSAPVRDSFVSSDLWETGIGQVVLSRNLSGRQVGFAIFLLDIYCLGVKDAVLQILPELEYEESVLAKLRAQYDISRLDPCCLRRLVEGGVDYARELGFAPHPDYAKGKRVLGDIDVSNCNSEFIYGYQGKPFFVAGPYDDTLRCREIIQTLSRHFGEDGYDCLMPGTRSGELPDSGEYRRLDPPSEMD